MDSKNKSSGGPGSGSGKKSQRADHSEAAAPSRTSPVAEASAADSSAPVSSTKPSAVSPQSAKVPKRRFRRFRRLVELPTKIPGKIEEGIEKGIETVEKGVTATVDILKDPVGTVQQVVEALQAPRGLVLGWAIALLLPLVVYLLDLGAGSLWHGPDAQVALSLEAMSRDQLRLYAAERLLPPPTGAPLGLWQMAQTVGLFGINEATLRLLPVLAALGSAMCLLAISIDVGVGRHATIGRTRKVWDTPSSRKRLWTSTSTRTFGVCAPTNTPVQSWTESAAAAFAVTRVVEAARAGPIAFSAFLSPAVLPSASADPTASGQDARACWRRPCADQEEADRGGDPRRLHPAARERQVRRRVIDRVTLRLHSRAVRVRSTPVAKTSIRPRPRTT